LWGEFKDPSRPSRGKRRGGWKTRPVTSRTWKSRKRCGTGFSTRRCDTPRTRSSLLRRVAPMPRTTWPITGDPRPQGSIPSWRSAYFPWDSRGNVGGEIRRYRSSCRSARAGIERWTVSWRFRRRGSSGIGARNDPSPNGWRTEPPEWTGNTRRGIARWPGRSPTGSERGPCSHRRPARYP